jgi:hypothetical protein
MPYSLAWLDAVQSCTTQKWSKMEQNKNQFTIKDAVSRGRKREQKGEKESKREKNGFRLTEKSYLVTSRINRNDTYLNNSYLELLLKDIENK